NHGTTERSRIRTPLAESVSDDDLARSSAYPQSARCDRWRSPGMDRNQVEDPRTGLADHCGGALEPATVCGPDRSVDATGARRRALVCDGSRSAHGHPDARAQGVGPHGESVGDYDLRTRSRLDVTVAALGGPSVRSGARPAQHDSATQFRVSLGNQLSDLFPIAVLHDPVPGMLAYQSGVLRVIEQSRQLLDE